MFARRIPIYRVGCRSTFKEDKTMSSNSGKYARSVSVGSQQTFVRNQLMSYNRRDAYSCWKIKPNNIKF